MKGRLISFEGPEGGGKSTQAKRLREKLEARGIQVLSTREPGGTPTGEIIRNLLQNGLSGEALCDETEALLFCASRAQLCRNILAPALESGQWVVLDRFVDSTLAYQGYGRGFSLGTLRELNAFATGKVMPDLTLLLDLPAEEGLARALARSGTKDRIEEAPLEFHKRLRNGYLEMAAAEPERFAVIDASKKVDEVESAIWQEVQSRLLP